MSRRQRQRANSRPWEAPEPEPDLDEDGSGEGDDTAPFYLSTGEPIDTRSAWQMPGQEQG